MDGQTWRTRKEEKKKKHVINHKSLRPGRQTHHHAIRLLLFHPFYLSCLHWFHSIHFSLSPLLPSFMFLYILFHLPPSISLSPHPFSLAWSTSPSHTSSIWLPVCPGQVLVEEIKIRKKKIFCNRFYSHLHWHKNQQFIMSLWFLNTKFESWARQVIKQHSTSLKCI